MIEALLRTKLTVPHVRPSLVTRPRLLARLDSGLDAKLTLISAPAGYGKTTLVADWMRQSDRAGSLQFCWLSLDEGDNDAARFLAYLTAALQTLQPDALWPEDTAGSLPHLPAETVATLLINELAQINKSFILVLDDYQLISDRTVHDLVSFLLDHLPAQMHLIIISRADPPLPVARLRGQGQLVDLRQKDLRFSSNEAAEFLNQVMELDIAPEDVRLLNERTEGWAAGLQMAAVSLREREDSAAFIESFSGSHRYVLDYLLEEVLRRQPDSIQRFLLQTSLLDHFTAPLCHFVIFGDDPPGDESDPMETQKILEQLEASNLFIMALDDQRLWYRYHRLFAELLRQRLGQHQPERLPILHSRASQWFEQHNLIFYAFDHALAIPDPQRAAALAEQMAEDLLRRSETATLIQRIQCLPEERIQERPQLSIYYAWAHLLKGSAVQDIKPYLPVLTGDDRLDSIVALAQAFIALFQGDLAQAQELSDRVLADLDENDLFWRSQAVWISSMTATNLPRQPAEDQVITLDEAAQIGQDTGNLMVTVSSICEQAHALRRRGRLHKAKTLYEQALHLAMDKHGRLVPVAGEALMGLGQLALEWNDLDQAEQQLVAGIEQTLLWREIAAFTGYILLAQLRQAQADAPGAEAAMAKAARLAERFDVTEYDDHIVRAFQARMWIKQGNLVDAGRWAENRGLHKEIVDNPGRMEVALACYEDLVLARWHLTKGDPETALAFLNSNLPNLISWERVRFLIEAHLLRSLAYSGLQDLPDALDALRQALDLGQPGGYIRMFIDEGEKIADLLHLLNSGEPDHSAYLDAILSAFDRSVPEQHGQPLLEPLSERELEVLEMIASGFTNREIAQKLVISLPTVKWHSSNIYGKLGVKNRTTAVAKAQALHILPAN